MAISENELCLRTNIAIPGILWCQPTVPAEILAICLVNLKFLLEVKWLKYNILQLIGVKKTISRALSIISFDTICCLNHLTDLRDLFKIKKSS